MLNWVSSLILRSIFPRHEFARWQKTFRVDIFVKICNMYNFFVVFFFRWLFSQYVKRYVLYNTYYSKFNYHGNKQKFNYYKYTKCINLLKVLRIKKIICILQKKNHVVSIVSLHVFYENNIWIFAMFNITSSEIRSDFSNILWRYFILSKVTFSVIWF